jgi:FAD/FMN-containing dehydrogenase
MDEVYALVFSFHGSMTAEHNDGLIRTPYLEKMYGANIYAIFKEIKNIFDPDNIFNPHKKFGGSIEENLSHIIKA